MCHTCPAAKVLAWVLAVLAPRHGFLAAGQIKLYQDTKSELVRFQDFPRSLSQRS